MEQTFYVYTHKDGDTVVYVGKGQGGRVLTTTGRLNKHHLDFMLTRLHSGDLSFAEITHCKLTESDALAIEKELINTLQPLYNRRYTEKQSEKAKAIAMRASKASMKPVHTPAGVFESARAAARYYKVTSGAIWHRIKDNPTEYFYVKD